MKNTALFRRWPRLADALPHVELCPHEATPCLDVAFPKEHALYGMGTRLWVKDDGKTGQLYGGNKVRKLEFLLAEAVKKGADRVWTVGAIGSNHCLATAIYAQELGLRTTLYQFKQPVTAHVRKNLRAMSTTGATMRLLPSRNLLPLVMARRLALDAVRSAASVMIPGGGSNALGVLGYVNAAFELREQIDAGAVPCPARIYVTAGTCGTFAGLWLGAKLAELDCEVVGVRVVDALVTNELVASRLIDGASALLCASCPEIPRIVCDPREISMLHGYFGVDYGVPTARGEQAKELLAHVPIQLESTYTAKTLSAVLDELSRPARRPEKGRPVLCWHTLSSVDLGARLAEAPDERKLPKAYHAFF